MEEKIEAKRIAEIYQHYGIEYDKKAIQDGNIELINFLIGKEDDIKDLTHNMAGFGTDRSQKVIIEYDKGYGYFIAKCIPMDYGASEETP